MYIPPWLWFRLKHIDVDVDVDVGVDVGATSPGGVGRPALGAHPAADLRILEESRY